ncbi:metalloreductase STEAP4-like isoform X2 [Dunckerocampus dactyliophorus]|uniref:metalloreductase STEAP4-like isoform X2 n=1 Tax=Dunckerocampus dactyliophorus TaxID=161453 RepID=UPI002405B972|nr:metalloreductase STEAP4-like isoform X2 [Dunckerocampus dactyliophorus]
MSKEVKPESMSLHSLGGRAGEATLEQEPVCIFGTGDLGRSLGQRLLQTDYKVVYGSRRPHTCGSLPRGAQVLVDVSNNPEKNLYPEANAAYLQKLLPGCQVVKGFNTLSAWALQNGPSDASRQVYLCGNSAEAKQAVAEVVTKMGLTVLDRGSLSAARELEDIPLQLFPEWRLPLQIALCLTAFFFFYLLIRDVIYAYVIQGKDISFRIMVSLANKVFPIVSLIMLSLCYLPGVIAAFLQLYRGTKYRRFPDWLDRWMLCRKQLGLLALAFAFLHVLYTLIIPIRYYVRFRISDSIVTQIRENQTSKFDTTIAWRSDSYYSVGILGFGLYVLLGITSLPSVSNALSWREFSFIQSKLGHLTLLLCTLHTYLYGWDKFLRPSMYKWHTPEGYMVSLVVPTVVLVLKLLLLLPCVDRNITRIRRGWERAAPDEDKTLLM